MIIGAMKCGTSSLFLNLGKHPEICPASVKEPEFFSERQSHRAALANYGDLWSFDGSVHKYALEASTGYSKYPLEPKVPRNIFEYGIRPRFIYMVRDPFDRIASQQHHALVRASLDLPFDYPHFVEVSDYFLQLQRFREYFPLEDILVLDFADLRADPDLIMRKVSGFLGLSSGLVPGEWLVDNASRTESSVEFKIRKSRIGPILGGAPRSLKSLGLKFLHKRYPPVEKRAATDHQRRAVYDQLKEGMGGLREVYGVDVGRWGFEA